MRHRRLTPSLPAPHLHLHRLSSASTQLSVMSSAGQVEGIPVASTGIALTSDLNDRFAAIQPEFFNPVLNATRGGGNLTLPNNTVLNLNEDERFTIWMRTAPLPR